ncbi:hypothetical protein BX600DRAFT_504643 [Xylariales sp. PMI_506]|nr:hypothetical protein BX600DRAFT_504643 [Xylariales sp. PMI_506]
MNGTSPALTLSEMPLVGASAPVEAPGVDYAMLFLLFTTVCAFLIPVVIILPPVGILKSDALLQTHSLAALPTAKSNLRPPNPRLGEEKEGDRGSRSQAGRIKALVVYPLVSCPGIEVTRARVLPQGLQHDRIFALAQRKQRGDDDQQGGAGGYGSEGSRWTAITEPEGELAQRAASLTVELWLPDEMKLRKQGLEQMHESFLIVRFPWREAGWRGVLATAVAKLARGRRAEPQREVLLPMELPGDVEMKERRYTFEDVIVQQGSATTAVRALNMSTEIPEELCSYLGVTGELGLFRIDAIALREAQKGVSKKDGPKPQPVNGLQDNYPILVQNLTGTPEPSAEVSKGETTQGLSNFRPRPNIILTGSPAHDENTWKQIRLVTGSSGLYNPVLLSLSNSESVTGHVQAMAIFEEGLSEEDRVGWVGVGMDVQVEENGARLLKA